MKILKSISDNKQQQTKCKRRINKCNSKPRKQCKVISKPNKVKADSCFTPPKQKLIDNMTVEIILDISQCEEIDINTEHQLLNDENGTKEPCSSVDSLPLVGFLKMSPYSKGCTDFVPFPLNPKENIISRPRRTLKRTTPAKQLLFSPSKGKRPKKNRRKTKSVLKKEKEDKLIEAVLARREENLEVVELNGKGRGVIAATAIKQGDFVVEYAGDLITWSAAKRREVLYSMDPRVGCYMYYFHARQQNFCIDATEESGRLGRLLNHSRRSPNCYTMLVWVPDPNTGNEEPRLAIMAKRDIEMKEELTYDYGDRDKEAFEAHPWLKS